MGQVVTNTTIVDTIPGLPSLFVGDTCGLMDPSGATDVGVDIANAVTIQNAMKQATSSTTSPIFGQHQSSLIIYLRSFYSILRMLISFTEY